MNGVGGEESYYGRLKEVTIFISHFIPVCREFATTFLRDNTTRDNIRIISDKGTTFLAHDIVPL